MLPDTQANFFLRLLIDYVVLVLAFLATLQYIARPEHLVLSGFNLLLMGIGLIVWTGIGLSVHLYDEFRTRSFSYEFVAILKTVLIYFCFFTFLFFYCFKHYPYPRTFTLLYAFLSFTGITVMKFIVKQTLLRLRSNGHNIKNIVIIGTGPTGMTFYDTILSNDHFGYRCIGFLDEESNPHINGKYLGRVSELTRVLEDHEVDDVIVALHEPMSHQVEEIIMASEREATRVRIIADCHRFCTSTASMNFFGKLPVLTIRTSPLDDPARQRFKRIFELCFTGILFITVFSWLFPIIAIAIKLSSKGPVFFKQERWGLKNKRITCYKFRSMAVNSDTVDASGRYRQASRDDNRINRVGRFLRKTNLDELPQFINVLLGDMSLVGPRPHPIPLHQESKNTIQNYMLRHLVKPGITGWAQVNGFRGETRLSGLMQKRVDYDLWYIENYSFWLDCQIIFQTLMNMIKGDRNAY
ncbi:undecaprenyl-phosphate glucose phosphotransferase [Chitinophaga arvensicola]|uniref:Putative colanic acid biosysnthesis UDP-glucose lipid carrier transferase n=1 Tax=Chitinophaga arvensicola TaxID=29529 RepID=A0A1I0S4U4_9BACT|nr:undecaprenyl-phosphate glucose phosphotransferase [Chitinophaga arvensicola]SEW49640.1 putative colanic acid biosysnthesis UDP-glucose lipid carrier transferase [Chitinophaga arvensicola]